MFSVWCISLKTKDSVPNCPANKKCQCKCHLLLYWLEKNVTPVQENVLKVNWKVSTTLRTFKMYYFLVVSLNFLCELPDYRVLSYYWLNAEATLKSQIERKYSTSCWVSHKTHNLISLGCQPVSGCFTKRTSRSLVLLVKTSCCIGHIGRINIAWY